MISYLFSLVHWFQPAASSSGSAASPSTPAGGGASSVASDPMGCYMNAGMIVAMMALFYFMMIRPQQKRQKEHDEMLKSLQKGTKVRTSSGILGEIVSVNEREAVIMIADKMKINVLRSHIAGVEGTAAAAALPAEPGSKA